MESMIAFEPLKAGEDLWAAYFDHADAIHAEVDPEDPPIPRGKRKAMIAAAVAIPYMTKRFYLAMDGAMAAGYASVSVENPRSPSYGDNKHVANFSMSVLPAYRRRGLGTRLLRHVNAELTAAEPQVSELLAPVVLESGRGFLDRFGGTVSLVQAENRLQLKDVDWAMVEAWAADGLGKNPSTKIITASVIPEEDIGSFSEVYSATINQQPLGDISVKMKITPEQIRDGEERARGNGVDHISIYSRERDGTVSGLTETEYLKESGHKVHQMLTGVKAECRGRGLGKLLKALMLLYVRREYPAAGYMVTGNADSNAPMLAINNELGFKKHLPLLLYKLPLRGAAMGS